MALIVLNKQEKKDLLVLLKSSDNERKVAEGLSKVIR